LQVMLKWISDKVGGTDQNEYDKVLAASATDNHMTPSTVFDDPNEKTPFMALAYLYFITIASVLGLGILGLPVKLSQSGFTPFFGSYTVCFFMQLLSLFFLIEILQRCYSTIRVDSDMVSPSSSLIPSSASAVSFRSGSNDGIITGHSRLEEEDTIDLAQDNGTIYSTSIMISYGLAASMAYGKLIGVSMHYIILPLIVTFSLIVVFGAKVLQHIITVFTFAKGSLLIVIVLITGVVAQHVQLHISNDWAYVGRSFLISTVALGGAAGVIPVVFPKIKFNRREMMKCYAAVGSGLTTVYVLNVFWCWFLLRIIPQMPIPDDPSYPNLYDAGNHQEIATIPLMDVIKTSYPQYLWIATCVDIFIVVSITISFITMGTGYKQTIDGFSVSWRKKSLQSYDSTDDSEDEFKERSCGSNIKRKIQSNINGFNQLLDSKEGQSLDGLSIRFRIREFILYFIAFGFILMVAMLNPKGFLVVMEVGASLGLNLQSGLFMVWMLIRSRKQYSHYPIPLPLHRSLYSTRHIVLIYFTFAVLYDVYEVIMKIVAAA
ncbi:hypothetical protein SAMD00019534_021390, partial [Acytostelium subglobosum LB1]|uniref:hypothetical protein n=1 Tax=Acytostelium subglobosum LB1 TaxID=1410327 RepID=UPI0006449773